MFATCRRCHHIAYAVQVGVVDIDLAGVPYIISVVVCLVVIRVIRTVVTHIANPIIITVFLIGIGNINAVVLENVITVHVGAEIPLTISIVICLVGLAISMQLSHLSPTPSSSLSV